METNIILQGDSLEQLKTLQDESIDCCMTSPPYWNLRDYGTAIWEGGKKDCDHKIPETEKDPKNKNNSSHNVRFIKETCYKCNAKRIDKQLGLESTFKEYINNLCDIFDEVKRVLKKTGTCWVNLGDTYAGSPSGGVGHQEGTDGVFSRLWNRNTQGGRTDKITHKYKDPKNEASLRSREQLPKQNYQNKCLYLIPQRFAIEMVNRGWILRNNIIWHKRNCMPSSVRDRFTVDFEYLFFFTKNKKYYFKTQYEPLQTDENRPNGVVRNREYNYDSKENKNPSAYLKQDNVPSKNFNTYKGFNKRYIPPTQGRNKRTVWSINPKPYSEAHFAVYPEELCETPLKAGCPNLVCIKCGEPKREIKTIQKSNDAFNIRVRDVKNERIKHTDRIASDEEVSKYNEKEYKPSFEYVISEGCNCETDCDYCGGMGIDPEDTHGEKECPYCKGNHFTSGIVLDPFFGSGTTGIVALKQQKKFIGIELNSEYIEIAKKRLKPYLEQRRI